MNSMRPIKNTIMTGLFLTLSACATQDLHLGEDVKSMQREQVYNKSAAKTPISDPVPQDGQKAQIVIDTFRGVSKQPKATNNSADLTMAN